MYTLTLLTTRVLELFVIFQAWSAIFRSILPNANRVDACAVHIVDLLDADEVVFFHQLTYLVKLFAAILL